MDGGGVPRQAGGRRRSPAARPTDDQLLDAARSIFATCGFQNATMEAIAETANSTKPTLYAHFGGKERLYQATFSREATALGRWMVSAHTSADDRPVAEQVRVYVMALFDYATAHPESFRMLFDTSTHNASPAGQNMVDLITGRIGSRIRETLVRHGRRPAVGSELLAAMMVGLVCAAARHTQRPGGLDPVAAGELVTGFIVSALRDLDPALLEGLAH